MIMHYVPPIRWTIDPSDDPATIRNKIHTVLYDEDRVLEHAAERLGITVDKLHYYIKRHNIWIPPPKQL